MTTKLFVWETFQKTAVNTSDETHDAWFRDKVLQALETLETGPTTPQADVMAQARVTIAQKRRA